MKNPLRWCQSRWHGALGPGPGDETMLFTGIDISNHTDLNFSGLFAADGQSGTNHRWDPEDFLIVEWQVDGGGWQDGLAWESDSATGNNERFRRDLDFNGVGDPAGDILGPALSEFNFDIGSGAIGTSLDIRVRIYADGTDTELAFDNLMVIGTFDAAVDPDDQISEATSTSVGSTVTGFSIDIPGDVDIFSFSVVDNQLVAFDIDRVPSEFLDSIVRLFDSGGNELSFNDDGFNAGPPPEENTLDSYLEFTFTTGGTNYLGVSAYPNFGYDAVSGLDDQQSSTGGYTLNLISPVTAVWDGNALIGNTGDGMNWGDANNWTVNSITDSLPAVGPPGDDITFNSAPLMATINLGANRTANSLTFRDDYRLAGNTLTVTGGEISVDPNVTATIASDLASGTEVSKSGDGSLVITGVATDLVLETGTLEVTSTASINSLTINGGTAIVAGTVQGDIIVLGGILIPAAPGDFNLSGELDASDIDALFAQLSGTVPATHARFDLVPDGVIDEQDVDRLIHHFMQREFGDVDLDRDVDITDFNALVRNFDPIAQQGPHGWADGNFDGDLDVDISDFNRFAMNFSPAQYALSAPALTIVAPSQYRRTGQPFELAEVKNVGVEPDLDARAGSPAPVARAAHFLEDFAVAGQRGRRKVPHRLPMRRLHNSAWWISHNERMKPECRKRIMGRPIPLWLVSFIALVGLIFSVLFAAVVHKLDCQ